MDLFGSLSAREQNEVLRVLRSPALWPLQILAGSMGFSKALACCGGADRALSDSLLAAAGYTADDLPDSVAVRRMIVGVRMRENAKRGEPLQASAKRVGVTVRDAQRGLDALRAFAVTASKLQYEYRI